MDNVVAPPGENWPQGFYKRHPEPKARRAKAIASRRCDKKYAREGLRVVYVDKERARRSRYSTVEHVHLVETGGLISFQGSLKVLVGCEEL